MATCETCRFWKSNGTRYGGRCENRKSEFFDWLVSRLKDDCAEHQPQEPTHD